MATLLGMFPVLTGGSRSAPVSTEDIADCAVALIANPDAHAGRSYRPTGPELISGRQMADAVGLAIGRRVRAVNLPFAMFLKVSRLDGVNPHEALNWRDYVADHRGRARSRLAAEWTEVVHELTDGRRNLLRDRSPLRRSTPCAPHYGQSRADVGANGGSAACSRAADRTVTQRRTASPLHRAEALGHRRALRVEAWPFAVASTGA